MRRGGERGREPPVGMTGPPAAYAPSRHENLVNRSRQPVRWPERRDRMQLPSYVPPGSGATSPCVLRQQENGCIAPASFAHPRRWVRPYGPRRPPIAPAVPGRAGMVANRGPRAGGVLARLSGGSSGFTEKAVELLVDSSVALARARQQALPVEDGELPPAVADQPFLLEP